MTSVAITEAGAFLSAKVCAAIRHPLMRDLAAARRDQIAVSPEIVEAIGLVDTIGAWWEAKHVAVATPTVASPDCAPIQWTTVTETAALLDVSQQAVKGLIKRGTVRGVKVDGSWRICTACVTARVKGTRCTH